MAKISVFNFISLDGYYKGLAEDISWHQHGQEEGQYSEEGLSSNNILLFGRVTYEMMSGFWPTQEASQAFPAVAEGMNNASKIVFSRSLKKVDWQNTSIIANNMIESVREMKKKSEQDMTVLGSGTIVSQLAESGLIDQFNIMIDPVAVGNGTSIFNGIQSPMKLSLVDSRIFKSGVILLNYEPIRE